MNGKHYVGRKAASFQNGGETDAVSGVALIVDEEHEYRAGDDQGYVLELECPYGTQAMAEAIWESVRGKSYTAFEARNAVLPASAELGDGVTVRGVYAPLVSRRMSFGQTPTADISAPGDGQVSHEYGYSDPVQRQVDRKLAQSRSYIEKTAEELRVGVEDTEKSLKAELSLKVGRDENDQIVSMLNASADEINIKGNRLTIDSTNFKVAADGTVTATAGTIGGWSILGPFLTGDTSDVETMLMPGGIIQSKTGGSETRIENGEITTSAIQADRYKGVWRELWKNSSPGRAFADQNITVPGLSDCQLVVVIQGYSIRSSGHTASGMYYRGAGEILAVNTGTNAVTATGNGHVSAQRLYDFSGMSSDRVRAGKGLLLNNSGTTENNEYGIPLAILGANV